jgi:hypothetical protein
MTCQEVLIMGRMMQSGAKEVLIKSVGQAILTYVMGVFKLPARLCEEITQLIRMFWWAEDGGNKKVHWVTWDKLTQPKGQGGMGFQDMKKWNTVFPSEASPTWKGVEHGLELVKNGIVWRISSGSKVQVWRDPWINREPSRKITMRKGRARIRWVS